MRIFRGGGALCARAHALAPLTGWGRGRRWANVGLARGQALACASYSEWGTGGGGSSSRYGRRLAQAPRGLIGGGGEGGGGKRGAPGTRPGRFFFSGFFSGSLRRRTSPAWASWAVWGPPRGREPVGSGLFGAWVGNSALIFMSIPRSLIFISSWFVLKQKPMCLRVIPRNRIYSLFLWVLETGERLVKSLFSRF